MSPTERLPAPVIVTVAEAMGQLRRLTIERAGYLRLGMMDRAAAPIGADAAPQYVVLDWFARCCIEQRIDPEAALLDIRAAMTRATATDTLRRLLAIIRCADADSEAASQARADEVAEIEDELAARGEYLPPS